MESTSLGGKEFAITGHLQTVHSPRREDRRKSDWIITEWSLPTLREYHATVWNGLGKHTVTVLLPLAHWGSPGVGSPRCFHWPRAQAPAALTMTHSHESVPSSARGLSEGTQNVQQLRWQRHTADARGSLDPPLCRMINSPLGCPSASAASWR